MRPTSATKRGRDLRDNNVAARERRTGEDLAVASTTGGGHCAARTKVRLPSPGLSSD